MSIALPSPVPREDSRLRTRGSMATSLALHALLFAWILLLPHHTTMQTPIAEISFLEGSEAAAPAAAAPAAASSPGAAVAATESHHFRREERTGEIDPAPQSAASADDQIQARLAAIQSRESAPSAGVVAGAPSAMWNAQPAVPGGTGVGGTAPMAMARGGPGGGGSSPLPMVRGTGRGFAPAVAPAPTVERSEASQPAREGESTARRTLAGATLMGPIADRAVLVHVAPDYPEWAKREAVEGSVTLYFIVRPDGSVKENVLVQKTAGFEDFDDNARTALRAWRFEPLRDGRTGEQWGTITFRFRIRDSG